MNVTEAFRIFEENKRIAKEAEAKLKVAEPIVKEWFRKSGKYQRGNVLYSVVPYERLDQKAVKEHLGESVVKFMVPATRETLSVKPKAP